MFFEKDELGKKYCSRVIQLTRQSKEGPPPHTHTHFWVGQNLTLNNFFLTNHLKIFCCIIKCERGK